MLTAEVQVLARERLVMVSMREILDTPEPHRAAKFIQQAVPKRFAHRIRMIESLAGWQNVPEMRWLHDRLRQWYTALRDTKRTSDLGAFTKTAKHVRHEGKDVVMLLTRGIHELKQQSNDKDFDDHLDLWLDAFYLSRIGTNLLLDQFIALASVEAGGKGNTPNGVVDLNCDVFAVCNSAERYVQMLTSYYLCCSPPCILETGTGPMSEPISDFCFVPGFLRYITIELLKNSFKATVNLAADEADLEQRPIRVLVAWDSQQITIRVSDRAGGIPSDAGKRIWSYLYGAAAQTEDAGRTSATPLCGYGVGLPLSRLHARYFGGDLTVTSFPGYGTDAVVVLPRLSADMKETMPIEWPLRG